MCFMLIGETGDVEIKSSFLVDTVLQIRTHDYNKSIAQKWFILCKFETKLKITRFQNKILKFTYVS